MRRTSEVLPFTLTEIFVLLFFALALLLVWKSELLVSAEETNEQWEPTIKAASEASLTPVGVSEIIRSIQKQKDSIPEAFDVLARVMTESGAARAVMQQALRPEDSTAVALHDTVSLSVLADSMAQQQSRMKERAQALEDSLRRQREAAQEQIEVLERLLNRPGSDVEALKACVDTLADVRVRSEILEDDLTNSRGQAQACFRRLGNGLDHPPCWATPSGRPEYAYEVILRTSSVMVEPVWPDHRVREARATPGMLRLGAGEMSYAEFARRAIPVFQWSARQEPECRHFVRIRDEVDGGKEAYKENLETVERFFYKLLVN